MGSLFATGANYTLRGRDPAGAILAVGALVTHRIEQGLARADIVA